MVVVGHGLEERQHLGPLAPGDAPEAVAVTVRRYRCRACRAVLVVGPAGLLPRRWYGGGAIAAALARYARGETAAVVREATRPSRVLGTAAHDRWISLVRWIDAAGAGGLFGIAAVGGGDRRVVAERVTLVLAARAGHRFGDDLAAKAFEGASIAA